MVLDSRGRTPLDSRVLEGVNASPTLIAATEAAPVDWREAVESRGAEAAILPGDADGRVSLPALLDLLGRERGVVSLLVEGGGEVLGSFFDQRLINKVTAVVAPMIIGGEAQTAVRGRGAERMRDALRLNHMTVERLGDDLAGERLSQSSGARSRCAGSACGSGGLRCGGRVAGRAGGRRRAEMR